VDSLLNSVCEANVRSKPKRGKQKCRAFAALLGDSDTCRALFAILLHFDNAQSTCLCCGTIYFFPALGGKYIASTA